VAAADVELLKYVYAR